MKRRSCRLPDGRQLAWRQAGEGPTMVLLHGWTLSGTVFLELAELLKKDFRVLLPDLPGHGGSTLRQPPSLRQMAEDLSFLLQETAAIPDLLCGWSLGGMVAMEMAARRMLVPRRLGLVSTTPRFTAGEQWPCGLPATEVKLLKRNLQREYAATLGRFFLRMFEGEEMSRQRLSAIRRFAIYGQHLPEPEDAAAMLDIFAAQDQRELPAKIDCPTLVLHGTEDRITPVAAGCQLAAMLADARLRTLPGIGHAPFLSCPDPVARELRSFAR